MSSHSVVPPATKFAKAENYVAAQLRMLRKEKKNNKTNELKMMPNEVLRACEKRLDTFQDDFRSLKIHCEKNVTCEKRFDTLQDDFRALKINCDNTLEKKLLKASENIDEKINDLYNDTDRGCE